MSDDKKDAVNIGVTLSGQLITAALAMIAVIGTFGTFIIDKRDVGLFYFFIAGAAFIAFVLSIVLGGKGINKARENGFNSNWDLDDTKPHFNSQAICCLLGILLFIVSVFCGKQKPDEKPDLLKVTEALVRLRLNDSINRCQIAILIYKVDSLKKSKNPGNLLPSLKPPQTYLRNKQAGNRM